MANKPEKLSTLAEAIDYFEQTMSRFPQNDGLAAQRAAIEGVPRPWPVFTLNHLDTPEDTFDAPLEFVPPEIDAPDTGEGRLARDIMEMLDPLDMLNPVSRTFTLGQGTGTLVTCFGIPINPDADDTPAFTRPLDDVMAGPPPDPLTSGLVPEMRERIALIKAHVPSSFKIGLPDLQGPFNVAHATIGQEALITPYTAPEKFRAFMERVTDLWLAVRRNLVEWIGPDYQHPADTMGRVTECSVNLVSAETYMEHILPHDRRIADELGPLHIHPCSGPHVFYVTLENLPVAMTEAGGHVMEMTAGSIGVQEALDAIAGRPIALIIGQELPEGREEQTVQADFDLAVDNPHLTFGYTGMHWRKKDRPMMRGMHKRLDQYWRDNVV